jgi:predicted dinucleotide-binding enzyme
VLVCGDDAAARASVAALAVRIPNLREVDAGPMRNARSIEGITALLVNLNRAHHAHTSIRILGLG